MLKFDPNWRFDAPSAIPQNVIEEFFALIVRATARELQWDVFERFKDYFATAAGTTAHRSSTASWAETDLRSYMSEAGANAPVFIEALYDGFHSLDADLGSGGKVSVVLINRILRKADLGWKIELPNLVRLGSVSVPDPIQVSEDAAAPLDGRIKELISNSLSESERLLADGRSGRANANRQAVQELLWLLESFSTVFRGADTGAGTVEGDYFNKIVKELRKSKKFERIDQVLGWMMTLHWYLSSPTGGGVRHGIDIMGSTEELDPNEARLFCNLIRSYLLFLLGEYSR